MKYISILEGEKGTSDEDRGPEFFAVDLSCVMDARVLGRLEGNFPQNNIKDSTL